MNLPTLSVERHYSAAALNAVINDPSVRPFVGATHDGFLDLTELVADPANVLLMRQGGGVFFMHHEPGVYEAHTQFDAAARGAIAVEATADALRYMFTRTDAFEILTKVPDSNEGALGLVRAIHGEFRFHRDDIWPIPSGDLVGVRHFGLGIASWAAKAPGIAGIGHTFHEALDEAKARLGATSPIHADDEAHDRYVGATVEMVLAGQIDKAVQFYNRWARFAGYGTVSVIARNPTVIDIGDAILAVRNDGYEVLLCR